MMALLVNGEGIQKEAIKKSEEEEKKKRKGEKKNRNEKKKSKKEPTDGTGRRKESVKSSMEVQRNGECWRYDC